MTLKKKIVRNSFHAIIGNFFLFYVYICKIINCTEKRKLWKYHQFNWKVEIIRFINNSNEISWYRSSRSLRLQVLTLCLMHPLPFYLFSSPPCPFSKIFFYFNIALWMNLKALLQKRIFPFFFLFCFFFSFKENFSFTPVRFFEYTILKKKREKNSISCTFYYRMQEFFFESFSFDPSASRYNHFRVPTTFSYWNRRKYFPTFSFEIVGFSLSIFIDIKCLCIFSFFFSLLFF